MANKHERKEAAGKLALQLREMADYVEKAGDGDEDALRYVKDHVDGYWHKLVLGDKYLDDVIGDVDPDYTYRYAVTPTEAEDTFVASQDGFYDREDCIDGCCQAMLHTSQRADYGYVECVPEKWMEGEEPYTVAVVRRQPDGTVKVEPVEATV